MKQVHLVVGVVDDRAVWRPPALWGAWCWWRVANERLVLAAAPRLAGRDRASRWRSAACSCCSGTSRPSLHLLYGVLPLLVSFIAEQLRVSAAQMVLDARGFESAQAVGELPDG